MRYYTQHMSMVQKQLLDVSDARATEAFGEQLGRNLRGGEVIELVSDLGGGKTTMVRGIAHGAGSSDVVGSPTFTLSKLYKAVKCDIYHYDFYRLSEAGIMEHELRDSLADPQAVVVIEWGQVVEHILPEDRLTIRINKTAESNRRLDCSFSETVAYLMEKA